MYIYFIHIFNNIIYTYTYTPYRLRATAKAIAQANPILKNMIIGTAIEYYEAGVIVGTNNVQLYNLNIEACTYGVRVPSFQSQVTVANPKFYDCTTDFSTPGWGNFILIGYPFDRSGTATFNGDGAATTFSGTSHGVIVADVTRLVVIACAASADARTASPVSGYVDSADPTKIIFKFATAPGAGSNNVIVKWRVIAG